MESSLFLVSAPVIGLVRTVCCQWLVLRLSHGKNFFLSIITGLLSGITLTLALTLSDSAGATTWLVIVNLVTAFSLGFCYWAFLNLNITSLRIRILRELLQSPKHQMTHEYLHSQYGEGEMLDRRLRRLVETNQIKLSDGRYMLYPTPLLLLTDVLSFLRRIIIPQSTK